MLVYPHLERGYSLLVFRVGDHVSIILLPYDTAEDTVFLCVVTMNGAKGVCNGREICDAPLYGHVIYVS